MEHIEHRNVVHLHTYQAACTHFGTNIKVQVLTCPNVLITHPTCRLVFTVILLGAMFGLTWAVVAALKDTQVQGGIMYSKAGTPQEIVKV